MHLLLATGNRGKAVEMAEALEGLGIDCVMLDQLPKTITLPQESGRTFKENAIQKAIYCYDHAGIATLADDSGILVEALRGELGIHTRRWGPGKNASDEEWIKAFLERMKNEKDRRARFVCTLAFIDADGTLEIFEGESHGRITETLEAPYLPGLPISACFRPDGFDHVYSALSLEEKNAVSHRGRALGRFRAFLASRSRRSAKAAAVL